MITEYIAEALSRAKYEIIDEDEPYYGEVPELQGVWATGKTLEECRHNLGEVIDGWLVVRLRKGLPILLPQNAEKEDSPFGKAIIYLPNHEKGE